MTLKSRGTDYETFTIYKSKNVICLATLLFSFAFFLGHTDALMLADWSKVFWDSVCTGQVRNFSNIAIERGVTPISYNIFLVGLNALWMAPLYFFERLVVIDVHPFVYITWLKVLLLVVILFSAYIMKRFLLLQDYDKAKVSRIIFLFLISGTVLHGNLGVGQEDCIENLFLLLALYYMKKRDYRIMSLMAGMMLVCKGRGIFFFLPLFLLLFGDEWKKMLKYGGMMIIPYIISSFFSHVIFIDYAKNASEMNATWHNFLRLFLPQFGDIPVFLTIFGLVCIICWSKAIRGEVKSGDYVLYPLIVLFAYISFLNWTSYWLIYGLVFLFQAMLQIQNFDEGMLAFTGWNAGYYGYIFTHHIGSDDNTMIIYGALNYLTGRGNVWRHYMGMVADYMPSLHEVLPAAMTAVVTGFSAFIVYVYMRNQREGTSNNGEQSCTKWTDIFVSINIAIPILFLVTAIFIYFR